MSSRVVRQIGNPEKEDSEEKALKLKDGCEMKPDLQEKIRLEIYLSTALSLMRLHFFIYLSVSDVDIMNIAKDKINIFHFCYPY